MARTRNLFISHSWAYSDAYDRFCDLLNSATNFSYRNYSVPRDNPVHNAPTSQALYDAIKQKITFCEIVIIMAGKYSTYSKWIQKEIRIAKVDFNKPILAVKPWANTQTSSLVIQNADRIVSWNTSSIVSAIRELT
ncbi:MAG: TIR domain-containing protein [Candidatus Lokiarchaeota archaeon]|nr:TIR domain-containing protein [Candidatus Lokiarchaeota archaeon]